MKHNKKIRIPKSVLLLLLFGCTSVLAQEKVIQQVKIQEINSVIDSAAKLMEKYYVSFEIGKEISDFIVAKNKSGGYKNLTDAHQFASQLTSDLRSINGDLHLNVGVTGSNSAIGNKPPPEKVDDKGQWSNYGFQEIKILDGNIGYLKINHFTSWKHFEEAKKTITASFNSLRNTEALIIDVRNNGGGFEAIVAYLISYLFEGDPIHLSDYYTRYNGERKGIWTTPNVPGEKLTNVPVYVLVNSRSASAAESLAYMLKHLKRATIIGEPTMGAGNGAMTYKVTDRFSVSIASETTINAITKTSFEKVGVIPTIETLSEEAFSKAYVMALNFLKVNNQNNIAPSNYESVMNFLPRTNKEIDIEIYKKYIGTYRSEDSGTEIVISVSETGLYAQLNGKGQFKLIPKGDHTFIVDDLKERVQFVFNQNNEAVKLIGIDSPMDLTKAAD